MRLLRHLRRLGPPGPAASWPGPRRIVVLTDRVDGLLQAQLAEEGLADPLRGPLRPQTLLDALAAALLERPFDDDDPRAPTPPPVLSVEQGLRRCLGRHELYARIARRFLAEGRQAVPAIGAALRGGRRGEAARLAHSLISSAGTLGAMPLSEGARALYMVLAETAADGAATALVEALDAEAARVHDLLHQQLGA